MLVVMRCETFIPVRRENGNRRVKDALPEIYRRCQIFPPTDSHPPSYLAVSRRKPPPTR